MLNRGRHAVLPAAALGAFGVTVWIVTWHGIDVDRGAVIPAVLTVVLATWALNDYYYRRLTRDRKRALAGREVAVLAEGVAAYMRQEPVSRNAGAHERDPGQRKSR